MINYRSVAALNRDVLDWLDKLPADIELVVGIPRSGLLVGNLLSLYMDVPLTDVEGLIEGRIIQTGTRYKGEDLSEILSSSRKVLVVDDSLLRGKQLQLVKNKVEKARLEHEILYGVVYMEPGAEGMVDCFYRILPWPRCFQWNIFHYSLSNRSCFDMDGVLCRNPTDEENDDGDKYRRFIRNVKPRILPSGTIGWLVTCRLEKYRELTEQWLEKHGIKYKHLLMMDLPNKEARVRSKSHASYKAAMYKDSDAWLFVESSVRQAEEIAALSGKEVLCVETGEMVYPNDVLRQCHRVRRLIKRFLRSPTRTFKEVLRRLRLK